VKTRDSAANQRVKEKKGSTKSTEEEETVEPGASSGKLCQGSSSSGREDFGASYDIARKVLYIMEGGLEILLSGGLETKPQRRSGLPDLALPNNLPPDEHILWSERREASNYREG